MVEAGAGVRDGLNSCEHHRLAGTLGIAAAGKGAGGGAIDGGLEPIEIDGLCQVVEESGLAALPHVLVGAEAAHGDAHQFGLGAELAHQEEPIAIGQLDIGEQQIEWDLGLVDRGAGGRDAIGRHDVMAAVAKHGGEEPEGILVVLDQQDSQVRSAHGLRRRVGRVISGSRGGKGRGRNRRQLEAESRAEAATPARRREPSAERLGERAADRQAQSEAAGPAAEIVVALLERVEDPREHVRVDSDPRVREVNFQPMGLTRVRARRLGRV